MPTELYRRYRPKTLKGVLGQEGAVASLEKLMSKGTLPHAILLSGPSGCGKTTIARIIRDHLQCGEIDYMEVDCAIVESPLDTVRQIQRSIRLASISGPCRIIFLEEAQALSRAGFSQQALLKLLEEAPDHVYFILASTDAGKLHAAIHTRCSEIKLVALNKEAMNRVLRRVIDKEAIKVSEDVIAEIIDTAEGSARKALVILEQVGSLEGDAEQIKAIQATSFKKDEAIALARALFNYKGTPWGEVAAILRRLSDQDPEGIRYCVLGYARSCLIGKEDKPPNLKFAEKAFRVIDIFSRNFYDSKQAGLAAACWEVIHGN